MIRTRVGMSEPHAKKYNCRPTEFSAYPSSKATEVLLGRAQDKHAVVKLFADIDIVH
jgi:hypothetical protein